MLKRGLDIEVINLRSIRPLDRDAIIASVKKTNRLMTIEGGWASFGVGAEICGLIFESEAFDYLDAPVVRLAGAEVPMPYAANLEAKAIPDAALIARSLKKLCERST